MFRDFWWGIVRERDHLEDTRLEENNIKMDLLEVVWGNVLD